MKRGSNPDFLHLVWHGLNQGIWVFFWRYQDEFRDCSSSSETEIVFKSISRLVLKLEIYKKRYRDWESLLASPRVQDQECRQSLSFISSTSYGFYISNKIHVLWFRPLNNLNITWLPIKPFLVKGDFTSIPPSKVNLLYFLIMFYISFCFLQNYLILTWIEFKIRNSNSSHLMLDYGFRVLETIESWWPHFFIELALIRVISYKTFLKFWSKKIKTAFFPCPLPDDTNFHLQIVKYSWNDSRIITPNFKLFFPT